MSHQQDARYFQDGCVVLYKRGDATDTWHYRLRVPGVANRYKRKSTGKSDFELAKSEAMKEWHRLCFLHEEGLAVFTKTFREIAEEVDRYETARVEKGIVTKSNWAYRKLVLFKYLTEFLGTMQINAIPTQKIEDYWEWRMAYHTVEENKKKPGGWNLKAPSYDALEVDAMTLRRVFRWAEDKNWIDKKDIPKIENPLNRTQRRRAYFSWEEYEKIRNYMKPWINRPKTEAQKYARKRLRYRVMLTMNTGLRTVESANLRWKDVDVYVDSDGEKFCRLSVHGKRKMREAISDIRMYSLLMDWKDECKWTEPDDFVFSITKGKKATMDDRVFGPLLRELDLEEDKFGQNRTLTSLRHSYATHQIINNKIDVVLLAKNMGTSVEMIERHYGHHESTSRANELAGKGRSIRGRTPTKADRAQRTVKQPKLRIV